MELPEYLLDEDKARDSTLGIQRILAAVLILLTSIQVFGGPLAPVRRFIPPYDQPWTQRGIGGIWITPDGEWTIHRDGYTDHNDKYVIDATGQLFRFEDTEGLFSGVDVSGVLAGGRANRILGSSAILSVESGPLYFRWQKLLRSRTIKVDAPLEEVREAARRLDSDPQAKPDPHGPDSQWREIVTNRQAMADPNFPSRQMRQEIEVGPAPEPYSSYVRLKYTYKKLDDSGQQQAVTEVHPLLNGREYFQVFDSAAFIEPDLWLTSDRGKRLHHLRLEEKQGQLLIEELQSVDTALTEPLDRNASLVLDPQRGLLAMVLADGRRYWYEPQSLRFSSSDRLPGDWEITEAALLPPNRPVLQLGLAFSKAQYTLLMQTCMVVFLASLLWLYLLWRQKWKSTAAATTADTH